MSGCGFRCCSLLCRFNWGRFFGNQSGSNTCFPAQAEITLGRVLFLGRPNEQTLNFARESERLSPAVCVNQAAWNCGISWGNIGTQETDQNADLIWHQLLTTGRFCSIPIPIERLTEEEEVVCEGELISFV